MPVTINGVSGAYEQPPRYGFDDSGPYTIRSWEGTKTAIMQLIPQIRQLNGTYEMSESVTNAKCRIEARFPLDIISTIGIETFTSNWEVFANEVEKDILESDLAMVEGISDDEKRKIREAINNPQPGKSPALTNPNAISVYLKMLNGETSVLIPQQILRHTQTVANDYAIKASLENVKKVISSVKMAELESMPSDILITLPVETSNREGKTYGWLKKFPTVRTASNQRTQIEQEWHYGLWDNDLYGDAL